MNETDMVEEETIECMEKDEILSRIDRIIEDKDYLQQALMTIEKIPAADAAGEQKINAIHSMIKAREETNQKSIELLKQMYQL